MKKRLPRVAPIRRYETPRYPSFLDPNPLDEPYPVPYPYGEKMLGAACALGITAGLGMGMSADQEQVPDTPSENPFAFRWSGLPHQTSMYGTGLPTRLGRKQAEEAIEKVFRESGYELKKQQAIEGKEIAFEASGYDPKKRVGYVFADWSILEEDCCSSPFGGVSSPPTPKAWLSKIAGQRRQDDRKKPDREALEALAILKLPEGTERNEKTADLIRRWQARRISLAEAKTLGTTGLSDKRFVALVSYQDDRFICRTTEEVRTRYLKLLEEAGDDRDRMREVHIQLRREQEEAALRRLEKEVREYISWARRQGVR